jgi:hypothetical protein
LEPTFDFKMAKKRIAESDAESDNNAVSWTRFNTSQATVLIVNLSFSQKDPGSTILLQFRSLSLRAKSLLNAKKAALLRVQAKRTAATMSGVAHRLHNASQWQPETMKISRKLMLKWSRDP